MKVYTPDAKPIWFDHYDIGALHEFAVTQHTCTEFMNQRGCNNNHIC